jgi:hypothetical protein
MNAFVATFNERAAAQGADVPLLHFELGAADNALATWVRANFNLRAEYYIGVLLGQPRAREPLNLPDALGLVGPVMFYLHLRHTITKSPHISRPGSGGPALTYELSPTYDEMWNVSVQAFSVSQAEVNTADLLALYGVHRGGAVDPASYIGLQMSMGATYNTAVEDYHRCRHERALHAACQARGEPIPEPAVIPPAPVGDG